MSLPSEVESGNKEYKLKVVTELNERFEQLASQMKWRLNEGDGIALYYLGVSDNGDIKNINIKDFRISIRNLVKISKIINAKIISTKKIKFDKDLFYYLITINLENKIIESTNVIFIGPSKSGKSTLIGNLSRNIRDDGKGKSRKFVFNHKHEIYSGETSSVSVQNKKFELDDKIININLIDTPGKSKYLKSTICALSKYPSDVIFLVIDPNNINNNNKFYIELLNFYNLNFYIILTKKDIYKTLNKNIKKKLNDLNKNKISYIEVSNVTTKGYSKINKILKKNYIKNQKNDISVQVCDVLNIPNYPTIYTGITYNNINLDDSYILSSSNFEKKNVHISSVHFMDKPLNSIEKGHLITFTLDIDIDNKTDIILSKKKINKIKEIKVTCNEEILQNQGICIYNNQYNVVKINYQDDFYILTNLDSSYFINLNEKIILKIDDKYYFMKYKNI